MQLLLIPFVILAGLANGAQAAANAQLVKSLGNPIAAAIVVYTAGVLSFVAISPFFGFHPAALGKLRATPWWAMVGGVGGAMFVLAMLTATKKLGTGAFVGLTVTSATVIGLLIDNYGWLGAERHPAGLWRVVGGVLMVLGVALVAAF